MGFSVSLVSLVSLSSVSLSDGEGDSVIMVVVAATAVEVATSVVMAVVVMGKRGGTGGTAVEAEAGVVADSPSCFVSFSSISIPALDGLASASSFYRGGVARLSGCQVGVQKGQGNPEMRNRLCNSLVGHGIRTCFFAFAFASSASFSFFSFASRYSNQNVSNDETAALINLPLPSPS